MPSYTCPTCQKTNQVEHRRDAPFRPFCSERCKLVDLGKWLDEEYRIESPLNLNELDDSQQPNRQDDR